MPALHWKMLVVLLEQRQVDQPFAGIVDDVEMQLGKTDGALQQRGGSVLDRDAQLAEMRRVLSGHDGGEASKSSRCAS